MSTALVWLRRDLRATDHAALSHALSQADRVYCAFVFDTDILDALPSRLDRRVDFIHRSVEALDQALDALSRQQGGAGSGVIVRHGVARERIPELAQALQADWVVVNRDYEPQAIARDRAVAARLAASGIGWLECKDQVIFDRDDVLTQSGHPFSVFTPYKNAWLKRFAHTTLPEHAVAPLAHQLAAKPPGETIPSLAALGFIPTDLDSLAVEAGERGAQASWNRFQPQLDRYAATRDFPAVPGTSQLSLHLRFGTISIRELVRTAASRPGPGASAWLSELIWREFYQMILWHHPQVVDQAFRPEYRRLIWDHRPDWFEAWREGETGYPIVDAGMRQLKSTGFMHNRLRMITASFLTKDLGVDWRLGERHFAQWLLDYDLSANNGGWQWAASTGCDAQPYFRIFNPVTQSEKFDPEGQFIRRFVPELARLPERFVHAPWTLDPVTATSLGWRLGKDYPLPLVDHAEARARTLARFGLAKAERA